MTGDPPNPRYACVADRVFDGVAARADAAVVIEGETIREIVTRAKLDPALPVVTEPGCTIIPGLIDAHIHFMRWQGPLYLAHGVTTIRDVANELDWILARRSEWRERAWPRLMCLGPMVDGPRSYWPIVGRANRDGADAARTVREIIARGTDGVKFYAGVPEDWLPEMVAAAHEGGRLVSMHCQVSRATVAADAGVDEFFHLDGLIEDLWPGHPPGWIELWGHEGFAATLDRQRRAADCIAASGIIATPTLAYWHSRCESVAPVYPSPEELAETPEPVVAWGAEVCKRQPDPAAVAMWRRALAAAERFTGLLLERGVCVLAGSDVPCERLAPGRSLWRELVLLVESGMTCEEALRSATSEPAERLRLGRIGRLEAGYAADLVFVKGDPTAGIAGVPETPLVIRSGRAFRPADLIEAARAEAADLKADPFYTAFRKVAGVE